MHTLDISYIFVAPDWRHKGAGKELVNTFIKAAQEIDASDIVCTYSRKNLGYGVLELFESCGFSRNEDLTEKTYGVTLSNLSIPGKIRKEIKAVGATVVPISTIDNQRWQMGSTNWKKNDGPASGSIAFSRGKDAFDQNLSFAMFDKSNNIIGLLLSVRSQDGYEVKTLSALGQYSSNVLYGIIHQATVAGIKIMGEDAMIIVTPLQQQSMELLEHISNGKYITLDEKAQYRLLR